MKFGGFPGERWLFEKMLLRERPDAYLVGIERNWIAFERARDLMPGGRRNRWQFVNEDGTLSVQGVESPGAALAYGDFSALAVGSQQMGGRMRQGFSLIMRRWTCCWLDYFGQISDPMIHGLVRLHQWLRRDAGSVPVAISFMGAREPEEIGKALSLMPSDDEDERRAMFVASCMDRESGASRGTFQMTQWWKYVSECGTPMITVCGVFEQLHYGSERVEAFTYRDQERFGLCRKSTTHQAWQRRIGAVK